MLSSSKLKNSFASYYVFGFNGNPSKAVKFLQNSVVNKDLNYVAFKLANKIYKFLNTIKLSLFFSSIYFSNNYSLKLIV